MNGLSSDKRNNLSHATGMDKLSYEAPVIAHPVVNGFPVIDGIGSGYLAAQRRLVPPLSGPDLPRRVYLAVGADQRPGRTSRESSRWSAGLRMCGRIWVCPVVAVRNTLLAQCVGRGSSRFNAPPAWHCRFSRRSALLSSPRSRCSGFLYLSLTVASQQFLGYQWDGLLLESGFLAIFLAPLQWLEWKPRWADPPIVIMWLQRWLIFRLMLLSGIVKLVSGDPNWRNLRR